MAAREKKVRRTKPVSENGSKAGDQITTISNADILFYEEHEAAKRDPQKDLVLFKSTCNEIRKAMKNVLVQKKKKKEEGITEHRIQASMNFLHLKKLNRLDKRRIKKARDSVNDAKLKVDSYHLQLQNLMYEVMHLQKEVTKCLEFRSKDEDIELVPLEEFMKEAPDGIKKSKSTAEGDHQLTLSRLEWELEQRKLLAQKLKKTEEQKKKYVVEIEKKKECLNNLLPTVKSILEASKPLHDELGMPALVSCVQHQAAKLLPRPLYVLYVQACAYAEACNQSMVISIEGNQDEARALQAPRVENDDDSGDSDQEEMAKGKRRRRKTEREEQSWSKSLQKFPLSVQLKLQLKNDNTAMNLSFHYLALLHIVTVSAKLHVESSSGIAAGELLNPITFLDCLFTRDFGKDSPNPSTCYQLVKLGLQDFSTIAKEVGLPYIWVQKLAGLEFLPAEDVKVKKEVPFSQHKISRSYMESTTNALYRRLNSRKVLVNQVVVLENKNVSIPSCVLPVIPIKVTATIKEWESVTWSDFLLHPSSAAMVEVNAVEESSMIYRLVIKRGSAQLSCLVALSPNYPSVYPVFLLTLQWKSNGTSKNNDSILELEEEVNCHVVEAILKKNKDAVANNMLSCQVQHLLAIFDVYLESESALDAMESPKEFSMNKALPRVNCGRNRAKPFRYIEKLGLYSFR